MLLRPLKSLSLRMLKKPKNCVTRLWQRRALQRKVKSTTAPTLFVIRVIITNMRIEKACFLVLNKIDTRFCILTGLVRGEPTSVGLLCCFLSARVERSLFYKTLLVPQLMLQRICIAHCKGRRMIGR